MSEHDEDSVVEDDETGSQKPSGGFVTGFLSLMSGLYSVTTTVGSVLISPIYSPKKTPDGIEVGTSSKVTMHVTDGEKDEPKEKAKEPPKQDKQVEPKPRQKVVIEWAQLTPVEWIEGGFVPGEKQFTATVTPKEAKIEYSCSQEGTLGIGDHTITATVKDGDTWLGDSVPRKLTVKKASPGLRWKSKPEGTFRHGGFELTEKFLNDLVDNPKQLKLVFVPAAGTRLVVKEDHDLSVAVQGADNYDTTPVKTTLKVKKGTPKVTWNPPNRIAWKQGWLDDLMNAKTDPPAVGLKYDPDEGDELTGHLTLKLTLADEEQSDWQMTPTTISKSIQVTANDASNLYQSQQRAKKLQEENAAKQPKPRLSQKELEELRQKREENKKLAEELAKEDVEDSVLKAEYPYGAANSIPHIHSYGSGFHLKIMNGGKIKRMNLVQDGIKYKSVPETLALAWEYDQENGTNVKKILETMLDDY
jgi:hypothetical protein